MLKVCSLQDQLQGRFIPPDLALAGLELGCLAERERGSSVPCLGWFAFLAAQKLSEVEMKWQKFISFSMHILRLDFRSFSAAQICE